jgi:hypothetical protein
MSWANSKIKSGLELALQLKPECHRRCKSARAHTLRSHATSSRARDVFHSPVSSRVVLNMAGAQLGAVKRSDYNWVSDVRLALDSNCSSLHGTVWRTMELCGNYFKVVATPRPSTSGELQTSSGAEYLPCECMRALASYPAPVPASRFRSMRLQGTHVC